MTEMVDRIAQAISDVLIEQGQFMPSSTVERMARAALAAQREPTSWMRHVGGTVLARDLEAHPYMAAEVWSEMVRAALGDRS